MSTWIIILLSLAGVFLLLGSLLLLLASKKPGALVPLVSLVRRIPWVQKRMDKAALQAVAKNPEVLNEEIDFGREARKSLEGMMQGRSEEERMQVLQEVQTLAESGNTQKAAEILRQKPKSQGDRIHSQKKKEAARKKRKAARKSRKRSKR